MSVEADEDNSMEAGDNGSMEDGDDDSAESKEHRAEAKMTARKRK